jgi:hypothetical protein
MDMKKLLNIVSDKQQLNESIEECGMPMGGMQPSNIPATPPPVSMTVSMNAQGIDQIKDLLSLMNKADSPLGPGPVGIPPSMPTPPMAPLAAPKPPMPAMPSSPMPAAKEPGMADLIKLVGEPGPEQDSKPEMDDEPKDEPKADMDGEPAPKKEMQAVADEVRTMTDELANSPDEKTFGIDAAVPNGDDLHKKKSAQPSTAGGNNPLALEQLRSELSNLYKTIKEST